MIDTFSTADVAAAIKQAKASADCVIFSANWGKTEEPMPTEYEKEWANFLMEQGVDVVIGTNPNVLQPYGYLTDDSGHNMLIDVYKRQAILWIFLAGVWTVFTTMSAVRK